MKASVLPDLRRSLTISDSRRRLLARLLSGLAIVGVPARRQEDAAAKHHHHKHRHRHKHHHHHHPPSVVCPPACPVCQTCNVATGLCEAACGANCKVCLTLADGGTTCANDFIGSCGAHCTSSAGCNPGERCVISSTDLATNTTMGLCGLPVGSGICTFGIIPCS